MTRLAISFFSFPTRIYHCGELSRRHFSFSLFEWCRTETEKQKKGEEDVVPVVRQKTNVFRRQTFEVIALFREFFSKLASLLLL